MVQTKLAVRRSTSPALMETRKFLLLGLADLRDPAGPLRSPRSETDTALSERNVLNSAGVGINNHLYREPIYVLVDTVGKGVANI